jgi:hypothetical protein
MGTISTSEEIGDVAPTALSDLRGPLYIGILEH